MDAYLKVLGTRGSFVSAKKENEIYGRNTSSFYLNAGVHLFLDAGTGILNGEDLVKDNKPIHILLSHVHIDHVMGLFEFAPLYEKGRQIHIYGFERNNKTIKEQLDTLIGPPYWPLKLSDFPGDIQFHDLKEGVAFKIGDLAIDSRRACHPDESYLYTLKFDDKKIAYALDHEQGKDDKGLTKDFFKDSDLLIFDGNDLPGKEIEGYGHSSWKQGIELKQSANIQKLLISHYGYRLNDEILNAEERKAVNEDSSCVFAKEGMEICL